MHHGHCTYYLNSRWLGSLYDEGKEVAQDHEQAAKWWLKASAQGDTDAQFSLGELYRLGKGRPQDNKMAYIWYSVSTIDNNEAVRARDDLERLLTPADLIDAQTLTQRYIKRRISEETQ
ncbi:tetratricopeptide repeat protein [Aeromonas veronii]|uniref:tetratricopeptide repeat protein n=1 Tax=Aeromonas veronii TaxID=654 RepID=UPI0012F6B331|nr:tetratricopeptide repeat protein [Aeromonas veronii]QGW98684.1 sel1 repeat family protein [Aeromonas veronii]